jgi:hypothetical protein
MFGRVPPIPISEPVMSHPMMDVDSEAVSHVGYDQEQRTLYLTFRPTGMSYIYFDVPLSEYEQLMAAPSLGTHVNRVIKPTYFCLPER